MDVPPNLTTRGNADGGPSPGGSGGPTVTVDQPMFQRFLATALFVAPTLENVYIGPLSEAALQQQREFEEAKQSQGQGRPEGQENVPTLVSITAECPIEAIYPHLHAADAIGGLQLTHSQHLVDVLSNGLVLFSFLTSSSLPLLLMTRCALDDDSIGRRQQTKGAPTASGAYGGLLQHVGPVAAFCVQLLEKVNLRGWSEALNALYLQQRCVSGGDINAFAFTFSKPFAEGLLCGKRRVPLCPAFVHFMHSLPKFVELIIVRGVQGIEERAPGLIGSGLARRQAAVERYTAEKDQLRATLVNLRQSPPADASSELGNVELAMQIFEVEEALGRVEQQLSLLDDEGAVANYHRFGIPYEYSRLMSLLRQVLSLVLEMGRQLECWCKRRAAEGNGMNTVDWSAGSGGVGEESAEVEEAGGHVLTVSVTMLGRKGYVDGEGQWWNSVPPSWSATAAPPNTTGGMGDDAGSRGAGDDGVVYVPPEVAAHVDASGMTVPWVPLIVANPQTSESLAVGTHPPTRETSASYGDAALRTHNANTCNARPRPKGGSAPLLPLRLSCEADAPMTPIEMAAATTSRNVPMQITSAHVARLMTMVGTFAEYLSQLSYIPVYGATAALGQLVMAQATLTLGAVQSL